VDRTQPGNCPLRTGHHLADLHLDEFRAVRPDLAIALDLSLGDDRRRVDFLIELDRSGRTSSNLRKVPPLRMLLLADARPQLALRLH